MISGEIKDALERKVPILQSKCYELEADMDTSAWHLV